MDWNPEPLIVVLFAFGFLGTVGGAVAGVISIVDGYKSLAMWMFTLVGISVLTVIAAAVVKGFIR